LCFLGGGKRGSSDLSFDIKARFSIFFFGRNTEKEPENSIDEYSFRLYDYIVEFDFHLFDVAYSVRDVFLLKRFLMPKITIFEEVYEHGTLGNIIYGTVGRS